MQREPPLPWSSQYLVVVLSPSAPVVSPASFRHALLSARSSDRHQSRRTTPLKVSPRVRSTRTRNFATDETVIDRIRRHRLRCLAERGLPTRPVAQRLRI